jgi:tryptophan halogenase
MNENKKFRFVVVGGGTAGAIAATYLKKYWHNNAEVVLVYDHNTPNIGIGESLTPEIYKYLNYVGVTRDELIKHVGATVKLGIKFKNWRGDDKSFYHSFFEKDLSNGFDSNLEAAYDLINDNYNQNTCYGKEFFENNRLPSDPTANQALHIDGIKFSQYIIEKFKNDLTIHDDVVIDVTKKADTNDIDYVVCKSGLKIQGDFFIDASGLSKVIFKHLENTWIDKSDWLPLDSCIPNPILRIPNNLPVCTTAEASTEGWILQVPLSSRIGSGYLFSSNFTSDNDAKNKFDSFLKNKFNTGLSTDRIIKFKSGYWKNQWVNNCLAIGLSSGFTEPLEATNIHHAVYQLRLFINVFNFQVYQHDVAEYNDMMKLFYERVYLFIRFCYTTGRTDSEFWRYMTNSIPESVRNLETKIKNDPINFDSMQTNIFNFHNFTQIAVGLEKINLKSYREILIKRNCLSFAHQNSEYISRIKSQNYLTSVDHLKFVELILSTS